MPSDFGGPYQREAQRLEAIANAYDDAAKRVEQSLLAGGMLKPGASMAGLHDTSIVGS